MNRRSFVSLPLLALIPGCDIPYLHDPQFGFSLLKPQPWYVGPRREDGKLSAQAHRSSDEELQALVTGRGTRLFSIFKYGDPDKAMNPTVLVMARSTKSMAGKSAVEMATQIRGGMSAKALDPDSRPVEGIVSGLPSAQMTFEDPKGQGKKGVPSVTKVILIPRGSILFMVRMAGALSGADRCEAEFASVRAALHIEA